MAEIGKGTGVATIFGLRIHGFLAWWLWRTYYLDNLPTTKKKLKVVGDWTYDLMFKPDVAMIKKSGIESAAKNTQIQTISRHKLTSSNITTITATQDFSDSLFVRLATIFTIAIRKCRALHGSRLS